MNKRCAVPLARPLALVLTRAAERPRNNARARALLCAQGAKWWPIMSISFSLFFAPSDQASYARGGLSRIPAKIMIGPRNWRIRPRVASRTLSSACFHSLSRVA